MKTIYLIGYMCSGKSTLGRLLKKFADVTFTDLDDYIVKKYGCSINAIFEKFGADKFREIERDALLEVSQNTGGVIATGGGTPCFFDNMQYMKQNGTTIYLKCSNEELYERLKIYKASRPLLKDKNDDEIKLFLESTLPEREKFYKMAEMNIDADKLSDFNEAEYLAKELIKELNLQSNKQ